MAISPYIRLETNEAAYLLDGLVSVGLKQISDSQYSGQGQYPVIRAIQEGRLTYRRADPNEHWKSWGEMVRDLDATGHATGDCEDLSAAVVAELVYNGMPARTYVYRSGGKLFHVVVKTDKWGLLDPSRAAGMEGNG